MKRLLKEFNEIDLMPLFEIETGPNAWEVFHIEASEEGLEAGGACNLGFLSISREELFIEWDPCFSLDEHLETLYDQCIEFLNRPI